MLCAIFYFFILEDKISKIYCKICIHISLFQVKIKKNSYLQVIWLKKVTISSKGQITLPKDLRDKYHMRCGERVIVSDSGEGIIIRHEKVTLRGILKGKVDTEGFEQDIKDLRKERKL